MIGTIRKHQTWLWAVIITGTIVSMIAFFSPTSQFSGQQRTDGNYGTVDGVPVTRSEYENSSQEAFLEFFLRNGAENLAQFDEQKETYQLVFLIRKLKQYHIDVDLDSVAQAARDMLANRGETLDALLQSVSKYRIVRDVDFERFVRHQMGIQQLASMQGLGNQLVTPAEARELYVRTHRAIATEAVFFSGSNFLTSVTAPTPAALLQFYSNKVDTYRIPDRVQVSYVEFARSNYLADVQLLITNMTDEVEANMLKLGSNYTHYGKTQDEARKKIGEELIFQRTLFEAHTHANDFAVQLFNKEPLDATNLAALAASKGMTVKVSRPFDQVHGPSEFDGGPYFAAAAFSLTPEEPFASQVLVSSNAVYVIAFDKVFTNEVPPLESIRDKVAADYKNNQAAGLARIAGLEFARRFTNGLPQGKTFAAVCAEARLKPVQVPAISRTSTNAVPEVEAHVRLAEYENVAFKLSPGKVSEFINTDNGGFVVFVEKFLPMDEAQMTRELPAYLARIRAQRQNQAFNTWFDREGSRALHEFLAARQQQQEQRQRRPAPGPGKS